MTARVTPMTPPSAAPARTMLCVGWALLDAAKKIIPRWAGPSSRLPDVRPLDRSPASIDTIDRYTPGSAVWAYIGGAWLTAAVADVTGNSALVRYAVPGLSDVAVEVVHVTHLQLRDGPRPEGCGDAPRHGNCIGSPGTAEVRQAQVTLGAHVPDAHGMCAVCADLAHFCWAPCPQAREAMSVLGVPAASPVGAR